MNSKTLILEHFLLSKLYKRIKKIAQKALTLFTPMSHFYPPENVRKPSWGAKMGHWRKKH